MKTKRCTRCPSDIAVKPVTEFPRVHGQGRRSWCKACLADHAKQRENNVSAVFDVPMNDSSLFFDRMWLNDRAYREMRDYMLGRGWRVSVSSSRGQLLARTNP